MTEQGPDRVRRAAETMGIEITIITMPGETRTAEQAATACGTTVNRILKSLIFQGKETGKLALFLMPGDKMVDVKKAGKIVGEKLTKADPKRVREETGFAIGGVAPFGHETPVPTWMDRGLLDHETVWAAGGAPFKVFEVSPHKLSDTPTITIAELSE